MKAQQLILSLIILLLISSCKKEDILPSAPDLYVLGSTNSLSPQQIYFYKNGVRTLVTDGTISSTPRDIFIDGGDTYIAGFTYIYPPTGNSYYQPCFWKNGVINDLVYPRDYFEYADAEDILVVNGDVYVLGVVAETFSSNRQIVVWKNGIINYLTYADVSSLAYSLSVYNNDIYACGAITSLSGVNQACYWKNGIRTMLSSNLSSASDIVVNEDGIHIAYAEYTGGGVAAGIKYWKDGIETNIYEGNCVLGKMTVKNKQVYIAGATSEGTLNKACYWKNGVKKDLANGNTLICRYVEEANNGQIIAFASSAGEIATTQWIDDANSSIGEATEHNAKYTIYNP
jgi:hypothetical protein